MLKRNLPKQSLYCFIIAVLLVPIMIFTPFLPTTVSAVEAGEFVKAKQIAAGGRVSLALKTDGTFAAWGADYYGQTNIPAGLSGVVDIAVGSYHSLALKSDGTVVAWGGYAGADWGQTDVPADLTDVIAIDTYGSHSLALKSNGTVVGWGNNDLGQINPPSGLTDVVAIATAGTHSLALRSNGTVVAWGNNNYGQTNVPTDLTDVVAIAAGSNHSLALKSDGTVVGWGYNYFGQINPPSGLTDVVAVTAGSYFSLALKSDGTVVGWGMNQNGQIRIPFGLQGVVALDTAGDHTLALKSDGTVVAWGWNDDGQTEVPGGLLQSLEMTGPDGNKIPFVFDSDQYAYTIAIDSDITSVEVRGIPEEAGYADIYINGIKQTSEQGTVVPIIGQTAHISVEHAPYLLANQMYNINVVREADKTDLISLIEQAQDRLETTVEGNSPGQYPSSARTALSQEIIAMEALVSDRLALEADVEQGLVDLQGALDTYNLSVVLDQERPVITLLGANPMRIEAGSSFTDPGAVAQDAQDGDLTDSITVTGSVYTDQIADYSLEYKVSDHAGNTATVVRSVYVKDTNAPVITLRGDSQVSIYEGEAFTDTGATAFDSFEGDLTEEILVSGGVDIDVPGTYTMTYNVQDSSGNVAAEVSRTVTVKSKPSTGGPASSPDQDTTHTLLNASSLRSIELSAGTMSPSFSPWIKKYTVTVDAEVNALRIRPAAYGPSKITVNGETLEEGWSKLIQLGNESSTDITITVNSYDGHTSTYILAVDKKGEESEPSVNNPFNEAEKPINFADVAGHWAEHDIAEAVKAGFITGFEDESFRPNQPVTRSQFVTMLVRALDMKGSGNSASFRDVDLIPVWALEATGAALEAGIAGGYPDGSFRPNASITRAEMAVMAARAMNLPIIEDETVIFLDAIEIPFWAKPYVSAAAKQGLINGRGGSTFVPNELMTRAEAAIILLRMRSGGNIS